MCEFSFELFLQFARIGVILQSRNQTGRSEYGYFW